jgi:adenylate cyclase
MLSGKDAEVTVLFCDIRRFSQISELLGPARTVQFINAALGAFSDCVIENHGVLVDYVGDELMALWGAPSVRADHAQLACQAAIQMWLRLPELNQQWAARLTQPISVGIGINTGIARVGNTGSHRKFKYGPLGNTVNLASRVRAATRHAKANILVTESTVGSLSPDSPTRRLCTARFRNISESVALYELAVDASEQWASLKQEYESALHAFEAADFITATRILGNLIRVFPEDGPTLALLSRSVAALADSTHKPFSTRQSYVFDPVWEIGGD